MTDFDTIRREYPISHVAETLLGVVWDKAKSKPGDLYACCPVHNESNPSFHVEDAKGLWHCFSCGEGGDVIKLIELTHKVGPAEAARIITGEVERAPELKPAAAPVDPYKGYKAIPAPDDAPAIVAGKRTPPLRNPRREDGKATHYTPEDVYPYYAADGALLGYVLRVVIDGKKVTPQIWWMTGPDEFEGWCHGILPGKRPMDGLLDLLTNPGRQVLVVEGEKCRKAAAAALAGRVVVVGWMGGTNAVGKTDFSPLNERSVIYWPDDDITGKVAMAHVQSVAGARTNKWVSAFSKRNGEKGGDVADLITDGGDVAAYIKANIKETGDGVVDHRGADGSAGGAVTEAGPDGEAGSGAVQAHLDNEAEPGNSGSGDGRNRRLKKESSDDRVGNISSGDAGHVMGMDDLVGQQDQRFAAGGESTKNSERVVGDIGVDRTASARRLKKENSNDGSIFHVDDTNADGGSINPVRDSGGIDVGGHQDGAEKRLAPALIDDDVPNLGDESDWEIRLIRTQEGTPAVRSAQNAMLYIQFHPDFAGIFAYNEFNHKIYLMRRPPWSVGSKRWIPRVADEDDATALGGQLEYLSCNIGINDLERCVSRVAKFNRFNPVKDKLQSLQWDGVNRLSGEGSRQGWLTRYFGAEPSDINKAFGRKWFISAVARIMQPGCQVDTVLIIEGSQGAMKSTSFRMLCSVFGDSYFLDNLADPYSKDGKMAVQGKLLVELAELEAFRKSEESQKKSWITTRTDEFRPPFARQVREYPRTFVIVGTENPTGTGYLKDSTGARRYWPVSTNEIDFELLKEDAEQLWAEAYAAFMDGEEWWLTKDEEALAAVEQRKRFKHDPWLPTVAKTLKGEVMTNPIKLMEALDIPKKERTMFVNDRVVAILTMLQWEATVIEGETHYRRPVLN